MRQVRQGFWVSEELLEKHREIRFGPRKKWFKRLKSFLMKRIAKETPKPKE